MERACCRVSREFGDFLAIRGEPVGTFTDTTIFYIYRPHTLPPQSLYLAHLAPYLASTQTQLETELQAVQTSNTQLANEVEGQRDDIENLLAGLEAVIADIEGANVVMEEAVGGADIRNEAIEVESEVGSRGRNSRL